jgi:DNA-binding NarL/FixJ family response regulator
MKLLLIDDHALFRDGLTLLIQHRLNLSEHGGVQVFEADSVSEALSVLARHSDVDLVLLDLGLTHGQSVETLIEWRQHVPHIPVVVLSADDRPATILATIDHGASGFIPKTVEATVMQAALRHVMSGGVYLPSLPADATSAADPVSELGLSERQIDVLRLLIDGLSNKQICRALSLSESTVKTHLAGIFRKLDVSSRTQAVMRVARAGVTLVRPR